MKIRRVGAELYHAGGRTDGLNEANRRFHILRSAKHVSTLAVCIIGWRDVTGTNIY